MEEREGWGSAINAAFGVLSGREENVTRNTLLIRLLFLAVFLGGTGWAVFNYYEAQELLREKQYFPSSASMSGTDADKKRLDTMLEQVKAALELRVGSVSVAQSISDMEKYVFADPATAPRPAMDDESIVDINREMLPEIVVELPPPIMVRAIMMSGKQHAAVMDIPGVSSGVIVKPGDTFVIMQKKGRIVRIAADKVVLNWAGRNWDIGPEF
ncbi:hypothetical protein FACS1894204_08410 [Synergistales bacterium]|nr:hypothetical protein FACS1894204_08410 [Synergistales bacterium]